MRMLALDSEKLIVFRGSTLFVGVFTPSGFYPASFIPGKGFFFSKKQRAIKKREKKLCARLIHKSGGPWDIMKEQVCFSFLFRETFKSMSLWRRARHFK